MSIDLTAWHGPLKLRTPLVVGACPLTGIELQQIAMVSNGAGAIVLPSLFDEQIAVWNSGQGIEAANDPFVVHCREFVQDKPIIDIPSYLAMVERATTRLNIPVIASINGNCHPNRYPELAKKLNSAGADGIEFYLRRPTPTDFASHAEFEAAVLETLQSIKNVVDVPVFIKLSRDPNSLFQVADELATVVDGLILFGRSPDFDIELDSIDLSTRWQLTAAGSIAGTLHSLMQMSQSWPGIPLTASGGIATCADLVKVLLVGSDSGMLTSAIYRSGPIVIKTILEGLVRYMEQLHVTSIPELKARGSHLYDADSERFAYVNALTMDPEGVQPRPVHDPCHADRFGHPVKD